MTSYFIFGTGLILIIIGDIIQLTGAFIKFLFGNYSPIKWWTKSYWEWGPWKKSIYDNFFQVSDFERAMREAKEKKQS